VIKPRESFNIYAVLTCKEKNKLYLVWWSRRSENSEQDCDIDFDNENPSLEAKICGKNFFFY